MFAEPVPAAFPPDADPDPVGSALFAVPVPAATVGVAFVVPVGTASDALPVPVALPAGAFARRVSVASLDVPVPAATVGETLLSWVIVASNARPDPDWATAAGAVPLAPGFDEAPVPDATVGPGLTAVVASYAVPEQLTRNEVTGKRASALTEICESFAAPVPAPWLGEPTETPAPDAGAIPKWRQTYPFQRASFPAEIVPASNTTWATQPSQYWVLDELLRPTRNPSAENALAPEFPVA